MKRFFSILLAVSLVLVSVITASAATDMGTAPDGELVYSFDFRGESGVWTPVAGSGFNERYTATVSSDGSSVNIKSVAGQEPREGTFTWGAKLNGVSVKNGETYSMVYKMKVNGTKNANNALSIDGFYLDWGGDPQGVKGWMTNASTVVVDAAMGSTTKGKTTNVTDFDVDANGYVTVMMVYKNLRNQVNNELKCFVLSSGGNAAKSSDWKHAWSWGSTNADATKACPVAFVISGGAWMWGVDIDIKDVKLYKGAGCGKEPVDASAKQDGELVYSFDFRGESGTWTPAALNGGFNENYTATVSSDGSSVNIKSIEDKQPREGTYGWGAQLSGVSVKDGETYSMVYKMKVNGTITGNNALSIDGFYLDWGGDPQGIKSRKSNATTLVVDAAMGSSTKGKETNVTGFDVDDNGYVTVMMIYENVRFDEKNNLSCFVLSNNGNAAKNSDWKYAFSWTSTNASATKACPVALVISGGAWMWGVDIDIKDVKLYKGAGCGREPVNLANAQDGDLVYSFNFNGESGVWNPTALAGFSDNYTATVSSDGNSVNIKSIEGAQPTSGTYGWGAQLSGVSVKDGETYSLVYKMRVNGTKNANDALSVDGFYLDWGGDPQGVKNWMANDSTVVVDAAMGSSTKGKTTNVTGFDVDDEGYVTVMMVYENLRFDVKNTLTCFVLSDNGDVTKSSDWEYAYSWDSTNSGTVSACPVGLVINGGAWMYGVDMDIKDAKLYKGDHIALTGDIDGNGTVQSDDIVSLRKFIMGIGQRIFRMDANNDKVVDIRDLVRIKKIIVSSAA